VTPVELAFTRDWGGRFGIDGESVRAPEWDISVHWTQRCFFARRGAMQVMVPFEACLARYTGETPKGPGRPEKKP